MSHPGGVQSDLAYAVADLRKTYRGSGGARHVANDGITLEIPRGEVFGLLGPNGAGKTTLVRQLVGLARPDSGTVRLFGRDLVAERSLAPRWVAYLAQDEPALAELPLRVAVDTTARLRGASRAAARRAATAVIEELDLGRFADRPMTTVSGGQRRLGGLASALAGERPVIVLDEPTAGLDPATRRSVWTALRRRCREQGTTIVLVTHNVLEAESILDRVAVLDRGRVIACDTPERLTDAVDDEVRVGIVWRREPPSADPAVLAIAPFAVRDGLRWSLRVPRSQLRQSLGSLAGGGLLDAIDDINVSAPSLEDVYLALGGRADDLERQ